MYRRSTLGCTAAAALLVLAGCGGKGSSSTLTSANTPHLQSTQSDELSALRTARATRQAGDLASAILIYRNLVANTSAPAEIKVELGDTLLESGAADDAIDVYSQVSGHSAARLDALRGMARAYVDLGDPAKALDLTSQAQELGRSDIRVLVDRGVALDSLKRHAEAQQCYRAVLAIEPRHVAARNDLALSLALSGQFTEAIALIEPLARSSAATPRVRGNMAVIYALKGDADRAAMVSRVDLDEKATQSNLTFLASVRANGQ